MAVNFGLIDPGLPERAGQMFRMPDIDKTAMMGMKLQESQMELAEQKRATQEASVDREAMRNYLAGGGDLFTPTGVDKALADLRGKVSPDLYMKLGKQAATVKEADVKLRKQLTEMDDTALTNYGAGLEMVMPFLDQLEKQYKADVAAGGEATARSKFEENRNKLIAQLQGQMAGPTTPLYNPQVLKALPSMTPDTLPALISGSKYTQTQVQTRLREAQAKRQEAEAAALASGKDWKTYVDDASGNTYRTSALLGKTQQLNKETGEWADVPAGVPSTARALGAKPPTVPVTQQIEEATDLTKNPVTDTERSQADQYILTGKMPQVGTGTAASVKRQRILAIATQRAEQLGMSPAEVEQTRNRLTASKEAAKRLTTQKAIIQAGEKNVQNVLDILQSEVEKLGGPQSPKVQAVLNKARTQWMGDPEYIGINQAYMDLVENMARVYSGQTGAGGTPVSFLKLAEKSLPENPTLAQVLKLRETVPALFEARKKATDDELEAVFKMASLPKTPGKVSPGAQAERDKGAAETIRAEYDKAVALAKDPKTDPEARKRAYSDARTTRNELKRMGVEVPELKEPAAVAGDDAMRAQVTKAFGKYEPDMYEYRVTPDGKVQRRKK